MAMTGALGLAAVTAVLKTILEHGVVDRGVTASIGEDVLVSALPPDRVPIGAEERPQLNLFLYHVTPDTGLRSSPREASGSAGASFALQLHYLLTAYGAQDFQAEILLGYALQVLHDTPVLEDAAVRAALSSLSSVEGGRIPLPALASLAVDRDSAPGKIRLTPEFLTTEEISRLWSALQARYRPSVFYTARIGLR